ncbi:MAG: TonB-dependent receptor, partial [Acidobacteriia bacterium]|nr:TonB-dependent receptor [Terriglobia bacterium]
MKNMQASRLALPAFAQAVRRSVWAVAFLLVLAGSLSAQITGDLKGSVLDGSGAVVPSVKISLKSLETGETRTAGVSADGVFVFNLLKIGPYEVRAEAAGFRAALTQVEVKTGEIGYLQFKLEVGQVTETITVSDAATRLDTENAQIQRSFTGDSIQDIPVNRNPNLFALSAPGVTPVTSNNPFLGSGSFNSNGGRGRGNNIMVDGITATDESVTGTGGPLGPLNFSAIKEVKVITNNFSAEYGRNASSQVLYITKGGTNELHGEAYYYVQNTSLNARPFFDRTGKTNITKINTAGWAVGAPVFIPKVLDGRNRVFWHTTYERFWQRGAGATRIARVPTPAQAASITDPTSRALFTQYQVPTSPSGQLETAAPNKADTYQFAIRGDVNITQRDSLWARYSVYDSQEAATSLTFVGSNLPGFGATSTNHPRQATLAETHVFGTSAVNEFRFGFGQSKPDFPIDTPYPLGTRIIFGSAEVTSLGVWEGLPQGREQRTYQFTDNFSLVKGAHSLKVGAEYYRLEADSIFDALQRPVLTYATFAGFASGMPATYQQRFGNSQRANRVKNVFAFFQDDWKVTRTFTVNLGIRMEFAGGPTEANGTISNLNLDNRTAHGAAGAGPFGLLENGKPAFDSNYNWGPRLGFAWSPGSGRTVVRGGYGVAYDFVFLNPITNQRFLPPFIVTGTLSGAASFAGNNTVDKLVAGTAQIQAETKAQVGNLAQNVLNFGAVSPAIAQNLSNSQVQQWNLGVQREFAHVVFKA